METRLSQQDTSMAGAAGTLHARTIPGLHEVLCTQFERLVPRDSQVLDLGAGTGAWASRIRERGYRVTAIERDDAGFALTGIEYISANLDDDFAQLTTRKFAAITAIEVIEHLANPRHFLRQCASLLADGGHVFVTTPNIESVPSRLRFLLDGTFRHFGRDPAFNDPTHISPIQSFMFERMLSDTGFRLVTHTFNRPKANAYKLVPRLVTAFLEPVLRGVKGGDCHIFVLARA